MDIYSTYYMLAALEEMPLEHNFFKSRYFPTNLQTHCSTILGQWSLFQVDVKTKLFSLGKKGRRNLA